MEAVENENKGDKLKAAVKAIWVFLTAEKYKKI